jgi:hypothetical protein
VPNLSSRPGAGGRYLSDDSANNHLDLPRYGSIGVPVAAILLKHGISSAEAFNWNWKYGRRPRRLL